MAVNAVFSSVLDIVPLLSVSKEEKASRSLMPAFFITLAISSIVYCSASKGRPGEGSGPGLPGVLPGDWLRFSSSVGVVRIRLNSL